MSALSDLASMGYALASARVAGDRRPVRFMYREPPDNPEDSGWRFFSGDEPQEYVDDPGNIGIYSLTTIAAIDPTVAPLLGTAAPCAFERTDSAGPFARSDFNFAPEEDA